MIVAGNKTLFMDGEQGIKVMQALGNETRLLMLSLLSHRTLNLSALAEAINLPQSTTAFHLKQLEGAGLVNVQYLPGTRGQQKLISKRYDEVHFKLPGVAIESASNVVEVSMPVGNYKRIAVKPTCGIATDTKYIGMIDDVRSFYEPEHVFAQILWFKQGFVEYDFPNNIPYGSQATELQFSMEICSEAPEYDLDWPSDITLSVNGVETGIWTSQGDFGGVRGRLTPEWCRSSRLSTACSSAGASPWTAPTSMVKKSRKSASTTSTWKPTRTSACASKSRRTRATWAASTSLASASAITIRISSCARTTSSATVSARMH